MMRARGVLRRSPRSPLARCLASKGDVDAAPERPAHDARRVRRRRTAAQRAQIDQVLAQIAAQQRFGSRRERAARAAPGRRAERPLRHGPADPYVAGADRPEPAPAPGTARVARGAEPAAQAPRCRCPGDSDSARPRRTGPGAALPELAGPAPAGQHGVARSGFEELLRTYPTSEDAPEAMVYIAETYAAERNQAAADSVYGLVVQQYPRRRRRRRHCTSRRCRCARPARPPRHGRRSSGSSRTIRGPMRQQLAREQLRTLR